MACFYNGCFLFSRTGRHLAAGVPDLSERCWAGERSCRHSALSQGTEGQRVLPSAFLVPRLGDEGTSFSLRTYTLPSPSECPRLWEWGAVGTNPTHPHCGLAANHSHIHHPLCSLCKSGSPPNGLSFIFDSLTSPFLQSDSLEIIVTIVNVNDNSPVFKQTNLTEVVPEVSILWK